MTRPASAGILLFRVVDGRLEVLLAHPGGPWFARQDAGSWTIPKGEPAPGEIVTDAGLLSVAQREFAEETGSAPASGPTIPLGSITQAGGKAVHAWAVEGDLDPATAHSNSFAMEWPPGSGRLAEFPEVDRLAWFDLAEARRRIRPAQAPLLDRLRRAIG